MDYEDLRVNEMMKSAMAKHEGKRMAARLINCLGEVVGECGETTSAKREQVLIDFQFSVNVMYMYSINIMCCNTATPTG